MSNKSFRCFFFNDTATTEIYTLSLHDALPIFGPRGARRSRRGRRHCARPRRERQRGAPCRDRARAPGNGRRSEEHTSELQSHLNLVCRLLLEKKKIRSRELIRTEECYTLYSSL